MSDQNQISCTRALERISFLLTALALGVGSLLFSIGCADPTPRKPNILIISIESLRWDHLGIAGYSRPVSPNIDALAARGSYFRHAYAQSSWTRPSVASTFTSTYQSTHRVYGEKKSKRPKSHKRKAGEESILAERFETLAEAFSAHGYQCFGWTHNGQLWEGFGFAQGFAEYLTVDISDVEALANLEQVIGGDWITPFLAFVHFVAPHHPDNPSERFRVYGTNRNATMIKGKNLDAIRAGEIVLSPADLAQNIARYDEEILQVDTHVGAVVRAMDGVGVADNTILILMADHGEEFLDHGGVSHGQTVYEELIRVPLILVGPNIPRGKIIDVPVQNIDIFPTLLEFALNEKRVSLQGDSLLPLLMGESADLSGEGVDSPRPVFSESGALHAVRQGTWKLIFDSAIETVELYDLAADPGEHHDRDRDPEAASEQKRLAALMIEFIKTNGSQGNESAMEADREISSDVLRNLEALGYLE